MGKDSQKDSAQRLSPELTVPNGRIDPRFQAEIGKQLRALYDDVVNEPIPDRFVELLNRLDDSSKEQQ